MNKYELFIEWVGSEADGTARTFRTSAGYFPSLEAIEQRVITDYRQGFVCFQLPTELERGTMPTCIFVATARVITHTVWSVEAMALAALQRGTPQL